jgi:Phage integrase, N-terminal SAM-like domain
MRFETTPVNRSPKLLGLVRNRLNVKHYSLQTEKQYSQLVKRFILFHGKRHPKELGAEQVEAFLTRLAVFDQVSASTQNQALSALLFCNQPVAGSSSIASSIK